MPVKTITCKRLWYTLIFPLIGYKLYSDDGTASFFPFQAHLAQMMNDVARSYRSRLGSKLVELSNEHAIRSIAAALR